jgi:hypothetical protein
MGGKNSAGPAQSTTTTPWAPQGEALQFGFDQARNQYNQGGPTDPNSIYAPMSGMTQQGIANAGQGGQQSFDMLSDTVGGGYLGDSNPYLQDVVARSSRDVMSGLNSTFGVGGRTGGGLHQQALGTALGDVATNVYAPAYEQERNRMMQASSMLPQAAQAQIGAGQLTQQDAMRQQQAQLAQDNQPYTNLDRYMQMVGGGNYGGTSTGSAPEGRGALSGALGGALSGAALGTALPVVGPGLGTAIGAGAGLLGII